ncbi:MAG: hypothetical protein ABL876_07100 [Chitinophagaceae bacterium]
MKKLSAFCLTMIFISFAFTHEEQSVVPPKIIFAVLDDGQSVEPIAKVKEGKLLPAVGGGDAGDTLLDFDALYYQPKASYRLIYGGKENGKVSVVKSFVGTECGGATAQVITTSQKVKLKGFEMALATNIRTTKPAAGVRKAPSVAERAAIEKLVIKEFKKNNVLVKGMKLVKLTSIDADNNKVNEIVGTYTVAPSAKERALLFFIATRSKVGGYSINYSVCDKIKEDGVMSGDIKDVDGGIYQELLLDILDFDDNGIAELFTITQAFEGTNFNAYQWDGKKWEKILEVSNYHCGY